MKKPDLKFCCRKCSHLLFVTKKSIKKIVGISYTDCPECGEEGFYNWILVGDGNFEKEFGSKEDK